MPGGALDAARNGVASRCSAASITKRAAVCSEKAVAVPLSQGLEDVDGARGIHVVK